MANIYRHLLTVPVSNVGAAVPSASVRVGGEALEIQFTLAPAALCELQLSPDNINWATAEDNSGVAIVTLGAAHRNVGSKSEYARLNVAIDAGAPQAFAGVLTVRKKIR